MRGNERRRSPPPRRDDRRFGGGGPPGPGWGGDRRRPRSVSPDRFRRSPPGKRFRRGEPDYDDYDRYPGSGGRFDRGDGYGRRRYDDRYDDRGPPPPRVPATFVEFVRDLPPHVGPEQANEEYRRYLADWWGDAIKAEFEERKGDPLLRRRFDPREIQRVMEERNELAQAAAKAFGEELEGGSLDLAEQSAPGPAGFTDPASSRGGPPADDAPPPSLAPALCWQPGQLAADLALAKRLMQVADKEKGIEGNPLAPPQPAAAEPAAEAAPAEPAAAAAGEEGQPAAEAAAGEAAGEQQAKQQDGEKAAGEGAGEGPAEMEAELSPEEQLTKLDQVLLYLWRVHGIDFYGGREYTNPSERGRVARRTMRGPKPSDEDLAAAAEKQAAAAAAEEEKVQAAGEGAAEEAAAKEREEGKAAEEGKEGQQQEEGKDAEAANGEAAAEGEPKAGDAPSAAAAEEGKEGGEQQQGAGDAEGSGKEVAAPAAAGGEQQQEGTVAAAGEDVKEYERRVTGFWQFRIEKGDPLELPLQRKRVEEELERFVESQIVKIEDNKWGNKLSSKLFMGREFVVKHIRNKHGHVLDAERQRLQEDVYWDNFRAFKQEEQRRQEEEQERVMAGMAGGGGFGGRGRGGMLPMDAAALPMNAAAAGMVMAPGVMAPIIMPTAGGMAPVILPMEMVMGMAGGAMGGRGGGRGGGMRGGRGGRGGGRGPMMPGAKLDGGGGLREYFDLDAPQNNRAVLDYGDL